jgi:YVTN family beta-propeller protein
MRPFALAQIIVVALLPSVVGSFGDVRPALRPGFLGGGVTQLPNGWRIAPAGRHVQVGSLPLAMVESPDGGSLFVSNNGYNPPSLAVVRLSDGFITNILPLDHAWLGLAWHPDGKRLFVSGAANSTVHELFFDGRGLRRNLDLVLGRPFERPNPDQPDDEMTLPRENRPPVAPQSFIGGLAISPDGSTLFATQVLGQRLSVVDLQSGHVRRSIDLPAEPYSSLVSYDGSKVFVSIWGGAKVMVYDARTLEPAGEIAVGEHPNALAITRDGRRLFVACANTNAVWAVDVAANRANEQISVALFPDAPPGSTPNHVSLSPDDKRLLVSNADNNTVAVVDVSTPGRSEVEGFIPTGWYPTAAMFSRDGSKVFVLSGKGLGSSPNPRFRTTGGGTGAERQYIAATIPGTLSILPTPDRDRLRDLTRQAYSVTPYSDDRRLVPAGAPPDSPVPGRVGRPSPIKHVFYVIRENRTYDQVFGDLGVGEGDPALTLFGEDVTPNAHALAHEFGVLDNFFVDAEVSYDGHAFSMGAYATDVVEKIWPTNYANRGGTYLSEGGGKMRNAYGNVAAPANGYIWDACARANVTVRSYGEFAHWEAGTHADRLAGRVAASPSVPGLRDRVSPIYPPWDLTIPDARRVDSWLREFKEFEGNGRLPALSIVRLGNDHTSGTRPGTPTPRAMVAENDLAVGRLVDIISHSKYWNESAIFILEDDAQNGPDHVDAHRSPVLVISPFSKRRAVDSTLYTTSGVLRTMELILGLPPMSQYDAAATPLYNAFQPTPDARSFTHLEPRVALDERNGPNAFGAVASLQMDFSEPDRAPDVELNEIVWRAVKGARSAMPPPVRGAFIRHGVAGGDGDDDRW